MTKRDYELIAKAINAAAKELEAMPAPEKKHASILAHSIGETVAGYLLSTNERFDTERFVRACMGVDEAPHARVRRQKTLRDNKARVQRILGGG